MGTVLRYLSNHFPNAFQGNSSTSVVRQECVTLLLKYVTVAGMDPRTSAQNYFI